MVIEANNNEEPVAKKPHVGSLIGKYISRIYLYEGEAMFTRQKNILIVFLFLAVGIFFTSCPLPGPKLATYTISYNANGAISGTVPATQTKTEGIDLTLATNSGNLARTGYTFAGWNTAADGSGTHYSEGAIYTTDADLILYAKWGLAGGQWTWTEREVQGTFGGSSWYSIASSSDGTKLAAVVMGGYIYTSTDGGATWTEQTSSGSRQWYSIASSSDGTKLAAVVVGGYIYTSIDGGATWTEQTSSGSRWWYSIASSSDGNKLVAGTGVDNRNLFIGVFQ